MYQLKQIPEDFLVTEISNVEIKGSGKDSGKYFYYKLIKKDWNTLDAVKRIAQTLKIPEKHIGFAGSKDRKAITEQVISFIGAAKEHIDSLKINGLELHFLGRGETPVSLGDLAGNKFEIIVRNLEENEGKEWGGKEKKIGGNKEVSKIKFIPNYFDEQRFGLRNVETGRSLVKKEFEKTVRLINDPHYAEELEEQLKEHRNDFIGALKKLPLRLLRMYVNAYQSCLWNETLAAYLKDQGVIEKEVPYSLGKFVFVKAPEQFSELKIPLIGFGSEGMEKEEVHDIVQYLMKKEKISYEDFIIKQIPELSLEGELRPAFSEVKELKLSKFEGDELNPGKKKVRLSFTLPKGSYATMAVRGIFG